MNKNSVCVVLAAAMFLGCSPLKASGLQDVEGGTVITTVPNETPTVVVDPDGDGYTIDDCGPNDATIHPGALDDTCDGVDQNCDSEDGDDMNLRGAESACGNVDVDEDGYFAENGDGGVVDCDDNNAAIHPNAIEIPDDGVDQDCNGTDLVTVEDADGDGFTNDEDCDDTEPGVHPGADEVCNSIDDDCDVAVDEGLALTYLYADSDEDGYGDPNETIAVCETSAEGYVEDVTDCDDTNSSIHPDADEVPYDGVDQNCLNGDLTDVDCDGYAGEEAGGPDCDDTDPDIYEDCDVLVDADGDGSVDSLDCNDADDTVYPGAEDECDDGIDQNCDGVDGEIADQQSYWPDADGDGYGDSLALPVTDSCGGPDGYATEGVDCDDSDDEVNPDAIEINDDGIDNNCDDVAVESADYNALAAVARCPGVGDAADFCILDVNLDGHPETALLVADDSNWQNLPAAPTTTYLYENALGCWSGIAPDAGDVSSQNTTGYYVVNFLGRPACETQMTLWDDLSGTSWWRNTEYCECGSSESEDICLVTASHPTYDDFLLGLAWDGTDLIADGGL